MAAITSVIIEANIAFAQMMYKSPCLEKIYHQSLAGGGPTQHLVDPYFAEALVVRKFDTRSF